MLMSRISILVIGILTLLVVMTSWFAASLTRVIPFVGGEINMGALTNVHMVQTTDAGAVQYQGNMQYASELNNGNVNFQGLKVTFYGQGGGAPWTLSSETGSAINQNSQVNLKGNVVLSQPAQGTNPPLLITTASAAIYPKEQKVTGTELITFSQPGTINQTSGVGFIADLQKKWIKLLSQVKSTYAAK